MGTSLGANTTLEVASLAPERLRGMVIEMPVLDHALLGCAVAFTPLMLALTFGEPGRCGALARAARLVPARRLPWQVDILLDWIRQDPEPSAAVIQGLFFGRTAPHRDERRTFEAPTLVIGHQFDIIHPFSDAGMLADELPNGRLLQANSIVELRAGARPAHRRDRRVPRRMLEAAGRRRPGAPRSRLADLREAAHGRHQLVELLVGLRAVVRPRHPPRSAARGRRAR